MTPPAIRFGRDAPRLPPVGALLLVGVLAVAVPGCEMLGVFANAFFPEKIKARYRLADQPTLVLVDDLSGRLGDAALPDLIASELGYHLITEKVLSSAHLVSPQGLYELAARLGGDFPRLPIDRVGTELGARQVIHIDIASVELIQEPGLYRPSATVYVKVIDAEAGKRLYPSPDPLKDQSGLNRNHDTVRITMHYRGMNNGGLGEIQAIKQALARRIGRDTAKLFHEHLARQPGKPLED